LNENAFKGSAGNRFIYLPNVQKRKLRGAKHSTEKSKPSSAVLQYLRIDEP